MSQPKSTCKVLLVAPQFYGQSFWNFLAACEIRGARFPAPPLGLITVAAMLPASWQCRLVNRNTEELRSADLDWADMVMTGGMLPQQNDTLKVIQLAHLHGKPVVVGGPDVTSSPEFYRSADFRVLGEAESIIDGFVAAWNAGARSGLFEAVKFTADVTRTPIPRFDLLKRHDYAYLGVQFARGCPFNCEFCDIIELYGRKPRVKTVQQMLSEIDSLYISGYRGVLDFVDDNFIGNKKAVKAFLPNLIAWQRARGYPFQFSTEASINIADDDALLALMREANFFTIFVGIESPDEATLVSMQKKQNTRRSMVDCVNKIHDAGLFVNAGFIVGFDSEAGSIAESMIDLIGATSIPFCMVGLLYALPNTQLSRRLAREGRLFQPVDPLTLGSETSGGDQCTAGLNFLTARPRREVLKDYRAVVQRIYTPAAYYGRVQKMMHRLNRPALDKSASINPVHRSLFSLTVGDVIRLCRLLRRITAQQPEVLWPFLKLMVECMRTNPRAIESVGILAAFYLHLKPFSRYVLVELDRQIAEIDSGLSKRPVVCDPLLSPTSAV
jgi:hypothetical protein